MALHPGPLLIAAGHGTIALPTLVAVVWGSALAGDLVSYSLGRRFGAEVLLRHGAVFGITDASLYTSVVNVVQRLEGILIGAACSSPASWPCRSRHGSAAPITARHRGDPRRHGARTGR